MRFSPTRILALAISLATVVVTPVALAAPAPASAPSALHIEIAVVRAGHGPASIDPGLTQFAADLHALPYQQFTRVDSRSVPTTPGASQQISLSGGLLAVITVDAADDAGAATSIVLSRGGREITHTTVKRPWGRAQVISVGQEGDDVLVVPIAITR